MNSFSPYKDILSVIPKEILEDILKEKGYVKIGEEKLQKPKKMTELKKLEIKYTDRLKKKLYKP